MIIDHCAASIITHYHASNMAAIFLVRCWERIIKLHLAILIYSILIKAFLNGPTMEHILKGSFRDVVILAR